MTIPLSTDVRALLEEPNFAHLATVMPEGSPQSAPVWVGVDGDHILIATGEGVFVIPGCWTVTPVGLSGGPCKRRRRPAAAPTFR